MSGENRLENFINKTEIEIVPFSKGRYIQLKNGGIAELNIEGDRLIERDLRKLEDIKTVTFNIGTTLTVSKKDFFDDKCHSDILDIASLPGVHLLVREDLKFLNEHR